MNTMSRVMGYTDDGVRVDSGDGPPGSWVIGWADFHEHRPMLTPRWARMP